MTLEEHASSGTASGTAAAVVCPLFQAFRRLPYLWTLRNFFFGGIVPQYERTLKRDRRCKQSLLKKARKRSQKKASWQKTKRTPADTRRGGRRCARASKVAKVRGGALTSKRPRLPPRDPRSQLPFFVFVFLLAPRAFIFAGRNTRLRPSGSWLSPLSSATKMAAHSQQLGAFARRKQARFEGFFFALFGD